MPAMLEDPNSSLIPAPPAHIQAASTLTARHSILPKLPSASITLYPITKGADSIPHDLLRFLHAEFNAEIERGTTYPMEKPMELMQFAEYWFGVFAVVAVLDDQYTNNNSAGEVNAEFGLRKGRAWEKVCLGTFYIKPNYPGMSTIVYQSTSFLVSCFLFLVIFLILTTKGRCSHICNAGFITTTAARGKGIGQLMGEAYLEYARKLVSSLHPISGVN